jgi:hypothetical protein
LLRLVLRIDLVLEQFERFVDHAALHTLVDEVVGAVVGGRDANHPALEHAVEIPGPHARHRRQRRRALVRL